MIKKLFTLLNYCILFLAPAFAQAQIAAWNLSSTTTSATTVATNMTASAISVSSGTIAYQASPSNINVSTWSTSATFSTAGKYWQFSITPNSGYQISVSDVSLDAGRTAAGPATVDIQYSLNNFSTAGTSLLAGAANSNTSTLTTLSATSNLPIAATTSTITFRVWGYNASSSGNFRLNNVSINGTVASTSSSTVTATALAAFGNVCINPATPPVSSFTINGTNLTTADVTVGALSGFTYSTDSVSFSNSLSISQPGGNYSQKIYVKFNPVAVQAYSGSIPVGGGGANAINVAASGTGVNTAPSVGTPASSSITTMAAAAGGTITDGGCTAVTERGVYWSTTSGFTPPGAGTKISETGTFSNGAFTENLSGLPANTTIYYKAYAVNNNGTTYTSQGSFTTLKIEPTNQPTNFTKGTVTTTAIPLTWTAAVAGTQAPDGYLIKLNTGTIANPVDGTDPANQTAITAGAANTKSSGTSYNSFTGYTAGTMYNFSIYSYTNSGTGIDFNTTNPPSFSQATLPAAATSAAVTITGTGTANISWTAPGSYNTANHSTLVFLKAASAVTTGTPALQPAAYTANTVSGSGTAYQNDAAAYCVYNGDGNSVAVSGLTANTTYYVLIYTVVDAANTDGTSSYSAAATANGTTLNTIVSLPYTQNFEGTTSEWTLAATGTNKWAIGAATNNGGTKALYISQDGGTTNTYKATTAQSGTDASVNVDLSSVTAATLSFDWKSNGEFTSGTYYDYGEVYINTGSGDVLISNANEFQGTTVFAGRSINLTPYVGGVVTIKFRWVNDNAGANQPPMAVDNVSIVSGALATLTTTAVSGITYNAATSGGTITNTGGSAVTARGVVFGTVSGPTLATGTVVNSGSGNGTFTAALSSLAANTTYYVRAFATNSTGTSYGNEVSFTSAQLNAPVATAASNIDVTSFTANWNTVGSATGYQLDVATDSNFVRTVLAENFDNFNGNESVNRATVLDNYTQTSGWTGAQVYEGAAIAKMGSGSSQGIITTPTVNLSASGAVTFSFDLTRYSSDNTVVQVLHATDGVTFVQVGSDITAPVTATTQTVTITGGTANSKIRIQAKSASNNRYYLDNIKLTQSSMISGYSNLSVSGNAQAVTGLTTGSTYYYRVRATGGNSTSVNSNVVSAVPYAFTRFNSLANGDYSNTFTWQGWNGTQWINYPRPPHTSLDELYINNNISLSAAATIKTLTLNNNILSLGNNDLTVTDPINNASATSYIRTNGTGTLKQTVAASPVAFPVGNAKYNPATLSNSGTSDVYSIRVIDVVYADGTGTSTTPIATPVVNHTWFISEGTAGGSNVTMKLQWKSGEEINGFDTNHVFVQHYNGTAWENYLAASGQVVGTAPSATNIGGGYYTASQSGISNFSPFTVGAANLAPLTIHLMNINAVAKNDKNIVNWEIASADEGDYFELEHSNDGAFFEKIATIKTNSSLKQYSYEDGKPFNGTNHYRLKMLSRDGQSEYSRIVTVNSTHGAFVCTAYPNPVTDKLVVSTNNVSGNATVILEDITGKMLQQITVTGSRCELDMSAMSPGIYLVHYKDDIHTELFKIVK